MTSSIRTVYDDLLDVHDLYARRIQLIESYYKQYPVSQAERIPAHTAVDNVRPQLTNIDILLGVSTNPPPWALMRPPEYDPRQPYVSFYRIAPALGTIEQQANATERLQSVECVTAQDTEDKNTILGGLAAINKINDWKGYIIGRVGQFLQG
jgi:hypothetical protein